MQVQHSYMLYTYYNFKLFLFAENLEFVKDYLNFPLLHKR